MLSYTKAALSLIRDKAKVEQACGIRIESFMHLKIAQGKKLGLMVRSQIVAIMLVFSASATHADCRDDVIRTQHQIETQISGPLSEDKRVSLTQILDALCESRGTPRTNAASDEVYTTQGLNPVQPTPPADDAVPTILGIELKPSAKDSKGRKRLTKKR